MISDSNFDQLQSLAALYVAGALTKEECANINNNILSSPNADDAHTLKEAIKTFDAAALALIERIQSISPMASTREQLMRRVRDAASSATDTETLPTDDSRTTPEATPDKPNTEPNTEPGSPVWHDWSSDASPDPMLFTLPAHAGNWEDTGIEGIQVRRLFVDEPNNRMTAMFRMEPGSSYVPHRHDAPEECYVLEGDLHVGDEVVLNAGDYQRADAGSLHGVQWTKNGCVLLISCSLHDEQMYVDDDPPSAN